MRKFLLVPVALILCVVLYVGYHLARGTQADWTPQGVSSVTVYDAQGVPDTIRDSVLRFVTWNIGYGGLGANAEFFLDAGHFYISGGSMVRSAQEDVEAYNAGIQQQLESFASDFVLLQEVDSFSKRSYYREQFDELRAKRSADVVAFAPNYINEGVPVPIFEPWHTYGDVYSGLATFSDVRPIDSERHQLPGEFPWPDKLFQLDRCLLVQRYALANGGTLCLINLHLSAYDDGSLKRAQLGYLRDLLLEETAAGHYVIAGGDWNLVPPNFPYDRFIGDPDGDFHQDASPAEFPDDRFTYVYDASVPSNRKLVSPYNRDSSFVTLIDYFLIGPNMRAVQARGIRQDFQMSDHQPVYVEIELLEGN